MVPLVAPFNLICAYAGGNLPNKQSDTAQKMVAVILGFMGETPVLSGRMLRLDHSDGYSVCWQQYLP